MGCTRRNSICLLLVGSFLLGGCSRSTRTPEAFARQVAGADRIVASDWNHGSIMVIAGQESKDLIRALSSAKCLPKNMSAPTSPCCAIEFFQGTNLLAVIAVQEEWFGPGGGEYVEKSGVLKALQRRLESDEAGRCAWVNHFAQDVIQKPEFSNIQSWSVETLKRYGGGEFRANGTDGNIELNYREIPTWLEVAVRAAHVSMPTVYVRQSQLGRVEALVFDWHHYGLLVGPSNYMTSFQAWYITNAAPGIYVYHIRE